ncbi:MAG: FAD-dependent monooxygenase [Acidobacteria bacterium]|nr:FAD-dependent monooxygenase [Acidobacteriota bacterium]
MKFDVAIIGGGPGGASAAIVLAKRGFRVVVLEKDRFPRQKLCGEFISPEVRRLARALGFTAAIEEAAPSKISIARLHVYDERPFEIPFSEPAFGLSRSRLDEILLRHAAASGALIREEAAVEKVARGADGSFILDCSKNEVHETIEARAVICAAGGWSRFTPGLSGRPGSVPNHRVAYGFKGHFDSHVADSGVLNLYFFDGGYCGITHIQGGISNVCGLIRRDKFPSFAKGNKELLEVIRCLPGVSNHLTRGEKQSPLLFTGPMLFRSPVPFAGSMCMVGDAAGFIDPFCGDGISIALHSGALAATGLSSFLGGECSLESAGQQYARAHREQFRRQFVVAGLLRKLTRHPLATRIALRLGGRNAALQQALFQQTRPRNLVSLQA